MRLLLVPASSSISSGAFADMDPTRSPFDDWSWSPSELRSHRPHSDQLQQQQHPLHRHRNHNHLHQYQQPHQQRLDQQPSTPDRELFRPYQRPSFDSPPLPAGSATPPRCGRLPGIAALLNRNRLCNSESFSRPVSRPPMLAPGPHPAASAVVRPIPTSMGQQRLYPNRVGTVGGVGMKRPRQEERARVEKKPRSASLVSLEGCSSEASRDEAAAATTAGKQSRYLREMDRRNILERLTNGEKQADLAKEFNVSRAAICNLNKHRDAVLSRQNEHPFAKHPKRRGYKKAKSAAKTQHQRLEAA